MAVAAFPSVLQPAPAAVLSSAQAGGAAPDSDWDFSFHDLVSIVNPLQHFPIVSTLYRKFTGDTIKPLERIAGDTIYGGWMGLASSVANLVFERETGKDFGDTVLAFITGDDGDKAATQVASANPAAATPAAANTSAPAVPPAATPAPDAGLAALSASLTASHIDSDLGQRALYAYRRSMGVTKPPADVAPAM
jgi:hypothetical protein